MPQSADYLFQTQASLEQSRRRSKKASNSAGNPIQLQSKLLAIAADPSDVDRVFIAESAGNARRIDFKTGDTDTLYRGPLSTPLTSLALDVSCTTLFAGAWDKSIWSWDVNTGKKQRQFLGHSDFVKCLLCTRIAESKEESVGDNVAASAIEILISGGADAILIIWNATTGEKLHVLKGHHTRGILDLAIDPVARMDSSQSLPQGITLYTAASDPEIRRFFISYSSARPTATESPPILAHDTSVNKLCFPRGAVVEEDCDLWTASSDKTAKCLSRSRNWVADTVLDHPDFVRDIAVDDSQTLVVTACRDEEVRVWDAASGECVCVYSGHFEEVTGLIIVGEEVVTISIDGTVRRWSLIRQELALAMEEWTKRQTNVDDEEEEEASNNTDKKSKGAVELTEDEERELAELMESD